MVKKIILLCNLIWIALVFSVQTDKIIAKVGREIILQSELDKRQNQMEAAGIDMNSVTKMDILNEMIESKLIIQEAKDNDITIDKNESREMAEREINRIKENFPDEETFKQELQKEMGLSEFELRDYYVDMLNEQQLKDKIIQNNVKNKIHITEIEIDEFYNEHIDELPKRPEMVEIGMILRTIKPSEETKDKALTKIKHIRELALSGDEFEELAKEYSDCPSGKKGGDLGFFGKGMMVKPFEEAAFALSPGEISDVVETQFGFHIIKMMEKNEENNEIRVSHILITINPTDKDIESQVKLMENIREKLINGADFAEIAKTYSEDDSTSVNGGVIGEFADGDYPEMFKKDIKEIDVGEYTEIIREGDLLYLFTKTRKVPEREYTYDEVYDQLREMLLTQKQQELYSDWIKELKKQAYVEILIDE